MPLTIDQLYEAYMDEEVPFAQDVYEFMGGQESFQYTPKEWASDWSMYLPAYDPVKIGLAERERDVDIQKATDILDASARATDRAYETEAEATSTILGREMEKSRTVAGSLGLRSGTLESAIEDSVRTTSNKVQDLSDRYKMQKDENRNKYNTSLTDTTLDFDKSVRQSKQDWYDQTLKMVNKLVEVGAFDKKCAGAQCSDGSCAEEHSDGICPVTQEEVIVDLPETMEDIIETTVDVGVGEEVPGTTIDVGPIVGPPPDIEYGTEILWAAEAEECAALGGTWSAEAGCEMSYGTGPTEYEDIQGTCTPDTTFCCTSPNAWMNAGCWGADCCGTNAWGQRDCSC